MSGEQPSLQIFQTADELAHAAAEEFVQRFQESESRFSVALAGGKTPKRVYELLATEPFRSRVNWSHVHVFFGDERAVPFDSPDSNYRMAVETLISKVPIPSANVHPIPGEGDIDKNARAYEDELKTFFAGLEWPRIDFVFLGLGGDGHTASLFPGSPALEENSRWVVATKRPQSAQSRITLTLPVFNQAQHVVFLVTGKEKAQRLFEVLRPKDNSPRYPAQQVKPIDGTLEWFVDADAASLIR